MSAFLRHCQETAPPPFPQLKRSQRCLLLFRESGAKHVKVTVHSRNYTFWGKQFKALNVEGWSSRLSMCNILSRPPVLPHMSG